MSKNINNYRNNDRKFLNYNINIVRNRSTCLTKSFGIIASNIIRLYFSLRSKEAGRSFLSFSLSLSLFLSMTQVVINDGRLDRTGIK